MSTPTLSQTDRQIRELTSTLVEIGLAVELYYPIRSTGIGGLETLTFPRSDQISIALRNVPYEEIYEHLADRHAFNVKMPDGALIQIMYEFSGNNLLRHRLAYFPSPNPGESRFGPNGYEEHDGPTAGNLSNVMPVPVRFDYDSTVGTHAKLVHPKSHLTLESGRESPDLEVELRQ